MYIEYKTSNALNVISAYDPKSIYVKWNGDRVKRIEVSVEDEDRYFLPTMRLSRVFFSYNMNSKTTFGDYFIDLTGFFKAALNHLAKDDYNMRGGFPDILFNIEVTLIGENEVERAELRRVRVLDAPAFKDIQDLPDPFLGRLNPAKKSVYFEGFPQEDFFLNAFTTKRQPVGEGTVKIEENYELSNTEYLSRNVSECGIFLRWRNRFGGWSYWLFDDQKEVTLKTKSLGHMPKIKNYWQFPEVHHFGFEASERWKLTSKTPIIGEEIEEIKDLATSPDVYLHKENGTFDGTWERVGVEEGSFKFYNHHQTQNFQVTIFFAEKPTLKRI